MVTVLFADATKPFEETDDDRDFDTLIQMEESSESYSESLPSPRGFYGKNVEKIGLRKMEELLQTDLFKMMIVLIEENKAKMGNMTKKNKRQQAKSKDFQTFI